MNTLKTEEIKYWLALLRTPAVGCRTFLKLLQQTLSPQQVFSESAHTLRSLGLRDKSIEFIKNPAWQLVDLDLQWLTQTNNHVLTLQSPHYPNQLKEIHDPPPLLFVRGSIEVLALPQFAMVGSRNPSSMGQQTALDFAKALSQHNLSIISGLALGIDACSHQGAIAANGFTVAVAGTGLDRVYPAKHKQLALDIVENGAIISEFPIGTMAKANHFPRRNRIISGLCQGLLVVEAAKQSGSLITARFALEQGREVFAIPGSIHNPLARGCNSLIRSGAKLVETSNDILEELGSFVANTPTDASNINIQAPPIEIDHEQQKLLAIIAVTPTTIDSLVEETGYSVEVIASILLILELQDKVSAEAGGRYSLKNSL